MAAKDNLTKSSDIQSTARVILELIEKCDTLEEVRESVKRIMNE